MKECVGLGRQRVNIIPYFRNRNGFIENMRSNYMKIDSSLCFKCSKLEKI